jgi:hypothetical protein
LDQRAIAPVLASAAIAAVAAPAAAAKTTVLHFFSKAVYSRLSTASGTPLPSSATPVVGDRLSSADNDYVGNHKHHAKLPIASDRISCTFTSITGPISGTALCDGTFALGGSMILADDFVLNFGTELTRVKITGGTGRYLHVHGTVVVVGVGKSNNSDITATVTT